MPTLLGFGALGFGATTVFAQMQSSPNQFWGVVAKPARSGILTETEFMDDAERDRAWAALNEDTAGLRSSF